MAETKKNETIEKEKMVKIRIPRDRMDNSAAQFVSVNERTWLIQKGIEVEVPECVAEALRNREIALENAYDFNSEVASN